MRLIDTLRLTLQAFLFPQACVLCRNWVIAADFSPVCDPCLQHLDPLAGPICRICGVPLPGNFLEPFSLCSRCRDDPPDFCAARAWGAYEGGLRRLLCCFKFAHQKRLAFPLAKLAAHCFRNNWNSSDFHWIVPIPLHRRRLRERGFDQTLLLARALSRNLNLPICSDLYRKRSTAAQSGLNLQARRKNLQSAFALRKQHPLQGASVLLLDDVMTSGSTAREASRVLRLRGGVNRIDVLTVARVQRYSWL